MRNKRESFSKVSGSKFSAYIIALRKRSGRHSPSEMRAKVSNQYSLNFFNVNVEQKYICNLIFLFEFRVNRKSGGARIGPVLLITFL